MLKKMRLGGIVLASLLVATGCQNEEIVSNEQQKGNYSLKVSGLVDSRTYVKDDGTVVWSKDDKMYVYGEGVSGVLTLQGNGGGTTGTFSGFVFGDPDDLKWAVFGDNVKATTDGAQFTISSITDPNSNSPMVGEIEGGNVEMEHLCGMVRITINNLPEGADVKLSGEDIAGTAEVKDGELSTSVSYESEISIKVAAGNQIIEVPVFASETESVKNFTLTIDNATFEFSAPIAVGKLSQDAIMNFDCVVNEETGKVEGFAIEVGTEEALYNALQTGIGESVSISLNKDIVLTGTWTPIGSKDAGKYFTGTLDGKGHTISGLSVSTGDYVSLISAAKDATIKNLTVEGSVAGNNAAGIVARVEGNSIIEDCISNVTVNGTTKAGGIVSNVTGADAKIVNCVNNGAVSCSKEAAGGVGGIIGYVNTDAKVEVVGCTNNGNITGTDNQTTGAVIGYAAANSSGLIVSFTNTGNISGYNYEGDNLGRWVENENGLILAGYCGTPANWTKSTTVEGNDGLYSALTGNGTVELANGNYTLPSVSNGKVNIFGGEDVVITINTPNYSGSDVILNGVTVKGSGYATGIQHVKTVEYNDVTIIGDMCLYGEKVVFNGCTFELNNQYIWTYGAKEVEFNNCVFNTTGKAILIYNEGAGASEVTVKGCTFNASASAKAGDIANQNCAAIEINNFQSSGTGAAHVLITEGNTYSSNFSGEWRIKSYTNGNSVTVNNVAYNSIAIDGKTMTIDANKNVTINE